MPLGYSDWAKDWLELATVLLEPGWQLQMLTEFAYRFVYSKARASRCQFYNVTVRIIGVDTLEVDTVQDGCDAQPGFNQLLAPGELCILVGNGECIVVRLSGTHAHAGGFLRVALKVGDQRTRAAISYAPVPVGRGRIVKIGGHFDSAQAKQFSKECMGTLNVATDSCDVMQTLAERHGAGNLAYRLWPGFSLNTGFVAVVDEHLWRRFAKLCTDGFGSLVKSPAWTTSRNFEDAAVRVIKVD